MPSRRHALPVGSSARCSHPEDFGPSCREVEMPNTRPALFTDRECRLRAQSDANSHRNAAGRRSTDGVYCRIGNHVVCRAAVRSRKSFGVLGCSGKSSNESGEAKRGEARSAGESPEV